MMTEVELGALVDRKLREHARGVRPANTPDADLGLDPHQPLSLETYSELLRAYRCGSPTQRREFAEQHGEILLQLTAGLGSIWRLAAVKPLDDETAAQNVAYGMEIAIQRYLDSYPSSEVWRREIATIGQRDGLLALAAEHETFGRRYHANAVLEAARCLDLSPSAAARTADEAFRITRARSASLPARLRGQPHPGFRAEAFHQRHWLAWSFKCGGLLEVPSLMAYACDENFSVRARIYRSLGQQPMTASVGVLLEALLDPHPFARAQAARSLGWISAPTGFDRLVQLGTDDPSSEVRRSARQAAERIATYWVLYGEPRPAARDAARWALDTARRLASLGLAGAAEEWLSWDPDAGVDRTSYDALARDLAPFSYSALRWKTSSQFGAYFADAQALEAAVQATDPEREPDDMLALYAVSKHRRCAARAADLAAAPGAIGWNARRALRALLLPASTAQAG